MTATPKLADWAPDSWTSRPARQQPQYRDPQALRQAVEALSRLPPIVVSWEVEALKQQIAEAQRGERFLLQGGDCAESFDDCESGQIARKLKILLQMSLVLLHGLKKPVIRVGRFAGHAAPRDSDLHDVDARRQRVGQRGQRFRGRAGAQAAPPGLAIGDFHRGGSQAADPVRAEIHGDHEVRSESPTQGHGNRVHEAAIHEDPGVDAPRLE